MVCIQSVLKSQYHSFNDFLICLLKLVENGFNRDVGFVIVLLFCGVGYGTQSLMHVS
jgi:hypothetical protein